MNKITVEGTESIIGLFRKLEHELRPSELKTLALTPAAREVVKSSRKFVTERGEIGRYAKRDIGIVRPRGGDRNSVYVGMRFKLYDINDQVQPVAPIIQHKTQGFKQNVRRRDGEEEALEKKG